MKKYIVLEGSTGDGIPLTKKREITNEEIESIRPIIDIIKNSDEDCNWETGEFEGDCTPQKLYIDTGLLTEEQVAIMNRYVPYGEYGIYSIDSIDIIEVYDEIKLL